MSEQRDPFNLSNLQDIEPIRDGWPEIRAQLEQRQASRKRWSVIASGMAAAALVVLALGISMRSPEMISTNPETQPQVVSAETEKLNTLIGLSQQLEKQLASVQGQVGSVQAESALYMTELEDLIAQIDDEININPQSPELWGQRVNLLLDLVKVYQHQINEDYGLIASL